MLSVFRLPFAFLLGFGFIDLDDLEIVTGRLQNKCFVDRAG
jgi:hypothetical protein